MLDCVRALLQRNSCLGKADTKQLEGVKLGLHTEADLLRRGLAVQKVPFADTPVDLPENDALRELA